jgi:hypothetical protein
VTIPDPWREAFLSYRRGGDALSEQDVKTFAPGFTPEDWRWVEDERARWVNVKERSAVAKASLALAEILERHRA